jgi:hypothetical protein
MNLTEKDKKNLKGCGGALFQMFALPFYITWRAYVAVIGWSWFIVPKFGLSQLTLPQSIGIWWVVALFSWQLHSPKENEPDVRWTLSIFHSLTWPAFILLEMWIVKKWFL